jgi:hypothetical protein
MTGTVIPAAAATTTERQTGRNFKTAGTEIHFNELCLLHQLSVYEICQAIDMIHIIRIARQIENHREGRSGTSAFFKIHPDMLLLSSQAKRDFSLRSFRYLKHISLFFPSIFRRLSSRIDHILIFVASLVFENGLIDVLSRQTVFLSHLSGQV